MLRMSMLAGAAIYLALWLAPLATDLRSWLDSFTPTPRDLVLVALGAVLASCVGRIRVLLQPRRRGRR